MSDQNQQPEGRGVDPFDYALGQLDGLNGVTHTKQATVRHIGLTETSTWIVQTFRQRDTDTAEGREQRQPAKDTIFVEFIGARGRSLRLVIPPPVAEVISRQRDQLSTINRRKGARQAVATRLERGHKLGNPEALKKARRARRKGGAR
jgi:hypothetical protein